MFVRFINTRLKCFQSMSLSLRKIQIFRLIFWCGNFVKTIGFRRVSGNSPKILRKVCVSTKFLHQEIRWNYGILYSADQAKTIQFNSIGLDSEIKQEPFLPFWKRGNDPEIFYEIAFRKISKNLKDEEFFLVNMKPFLNVAKFFRIALSQIKFW